MLIYLIEDCKNAPGRIYGATRTEPDAQEFAVLLENVLNTECDVKAFKLWNNAPSLVQVIEIYTP